MGVFDALNQPFGTAAVGQDQRGPDFLLAVLVLAHPPHAEGGGLFAGGIRDPGRSTPLRIDDATIDPLGGALAHRLQEAAHPFFDLLEVRGHALPGGDEIGDRQPLAQPFQKVDARRRQRADLLAARIYIPIARQPQHATGVHGDPQHQHRGENGLQQKPILQYLLRCRVIWFIHTKKPLISAK